MSSWTQPKCERCWIRDTTTPLDDGGVTIRRPRILTDSTVESCAFCGELTIIGLYVRVDPSTVPFPTLDDQDAGEGAALAPVGLVRVHPPDSPDGNDFQWTVEGDLRANNDETNYEYEEAIHTIVARSRFNADIEFDSETSGFYAYAQTEAAALFVELVANSIGEHLDRVA